MPAEEHGKQSVPVRLRRGSALLMLLFVTACGGQPDEQQVTEPTTSPQGSGTANEPDENEPDEK